MSGQPPGTIAVSPGEFLPALSGRRVFFDALYGNHGDRLLTLAAEALIERAGIAPVRSVRSAEFILVNGGGGMADGWSGLDRLAGYCRSFPAVPLAVLRSSFHFTHSSLSELCDVRRAELWLWARERPSFELLLRQHPLIEELRRVARPGTFWSSSATIGNPRRTAPVRWRPPGSASLRSLCGAGREGSWLRRCAAGRIGHPGSAGQRWSMRRSATRKPPACRP